jgi:hypothetical protein
MMAKYGWTSERLATLYTRKADIEALARAIAGHEK